MQYATKKECSSLLALLAEESLRACKARKESEKSVGVRWVGNHIVTVEGFYEGWLIRVALPLYPQGKEWAERQIQEAALRDNGQFYYSVRELAGIVLAEITAYGIPQHGISGTLGEMIQKLDSFL